MKKNNVCLLILAISITATQVRGQAVSINEDNSAPNAHAILDVRSFNKGVLIPRVSTTGRLAIPNTKGLLVYDSTAGSFWYNNGSSWQPLTLEGASTDSGWSLNGNSSGVKPIFIGTTDGKAFGIKVNGRPSGLIDSVSGNSSWGYGTGLFRGSGSAHHNTALGHFALSSNTTGVNNTAGGSYALFSNSSGTFNTAVGSSAMYSNTTGSQNVAIGDGSMQLNTVGSFNTANGSGSLHSNTIGSYNTATGYQALYSNTTGSDNTATGYQALFSNTDGEFNTASGAYSLYSNTIGESNTACGAYSLYSNSTGLQNLALGSHALYSNTFGNANAAGGYYSLYANTEGTNNIAGGDSSLLNTTTGNSNIGIGQGALKTNSTGSGNIAIGAGADVSSANLSNAIALGAGAIVNASNKIRIGNSAVTVIEGQVPFTTPSDGRFKYQVKEDVKGLDFILQLRPLTYRFDTRRFDDQVKEAQPGTRATNPAMETAYKQASAIRRSGFIAQEVEKAATAAGYDFSGIIRPAAEQDHYGLSYAAFVVPLVKGMQEEQQLIRAQDEKLASLQERIRKNNELCQQIPDMEQQLARLLQLARSLKPARQSGSH